jgi:UDP-N-acetylglucosamine--N-acetylmuramyl-(pentapeptide) pyrophosphoryl-undecaprenol N-acetylglucosamine transferase
MIICIAGGTGGHVFPAHALEQEFSYRANAPLIHFITDQRTASLFSHKHHGRVFCMPSEKPSKRFLFLLSLGLNFFKCLYRFIKKRPHVVCGFGGYVTFSGVLAAWCLRIPTVIHEQNAHMGQVNRFLSKIATVTTTAFQNTQGLSVKKSFWVGMPSRFCGNDSLFDEKKNPSHPLKEDTFCLFITGGSQGAKIFSTLIPKALTQLKPHTQKNMRIIQQVRQEDMSMVREIYGHHFFKEVVLAPFFSDMITHYQNADLVIARAGASTLFELKTLQKPAIIIPFAKAKDNHQLANARYFQDHGACWLLEEKSLHDHQLSLFLQKIMDYPEERDKKIQKLKELSSIKTPYVLVEIIENLIKRN